MLKVFFWNNSPCPHFSILTNKKKKFLCVFAVQINNFVWRNEKIYLIFKAMLTQVIGIFFTGILFREWWWWCWMTLNQISKKCLFKSLKKMVFFPNKSRCFLTLKFYYVLFYSEFLFEIKFFYMTLSNFGNICYFWIFKRLFLFDF